MHSGLARRRGSDAMDAPLSDVEFVALARDAFELLEDEAKLSGAGTGPVVAGPVVAGTGPVVAGTDPVVAGTGPVVGSRSCAAAACANEHDA